MKINYLINIKLIAIIYAFITNKFFSILLKIYREVVGKDNAMWQKSYGRINEKMWQLTLCVNYSLAH